MAPVRVSKPFWKDNPHEIARLFNNVIDVEVSESLNTDWVLVDSSHIQEMEPVNTLDDLKLQVDKLV